MNRPLGAIGVLLAMASASGWTDDATSAIELRHGQFIASGTAVPPDRSATGWQPRPIPDCWKKSQPGVGGIGWYRFDVVLISAPSEPWSIVTTLRATAYVNSKAVGGTGDLASRAASNWSAPRIFTVPPDLLRAGVNEIQIGIQANADSYGGLYDVRIGPERLLRPRYRMLYFLKVTLNQALVVISLTLALLFTLLWLRRRSDTIYGLFAIASAFWAGKPFLYLIRDPPLDTRIWGWLVDAHIFWMAVLLVLVLHRSFGIQRRWIERVTLLIAIAASTMLLPVHEENIRPVLQSTTLPVALYVLFVAIANAWRIRRGEEIAVALGLSVFTLLGVHDVALSAGILSHQDWYLLHYGLSAVCLSFGWLLISRFSKALDSAESTSEDLARQVEEKRRELEASYQRMQELQRREAIAAERERIMRDLHDGLGGQLVSALALAQSQSSASIAQTLREALDDLRVVIDSLDPVEGDLLTLLGTVRSRFESRLAQHGLRFEWGVSDIPTIPGFGPDQALQVLRIVQEAITNILKHAKARVVTVRTGLAVPKEGNPAEVFVEVSDDGIGLGPARPEGRGLRSMRERAGRLGGRLEVESARGGTSLRLWLPLSSVA